MYVTLSVTWIDENGEYAPRYMDSRGMTPKLFQIRIEFEDASEGCVYIHIEDPISIEKDKWQHFYNCCKSDDNTRDRLVFYTDHGESSIELAKNYIVFSNLTQGYMKLTHKIVVRVPFEKCNDVIKEMNDCIQKSLW